MRAETTFIERAEVNPSVAASNIATNDGGEKTGYPMGEIFRSYPASIETPLLSGFLDLSFFFDKLDRARLLSSFVAVPNEP
jgi:hypothetical protein